MKVLTYIIFAIILIAGCSKEDNPLTPPSEHFDPEGWIIRDATTRPILVVWQGVIQNNWKGTDVNDTLYAPLNALSDHYTIKFIDASGNQINPPSDADHQLAWEITHSSRLTIIRDNPTDYAFHLKGLSEGTTTLEFQVAHLGHVDVRTPKIPVIIKLDTSAHGEPVGIKLFNEASGSLLAEADNVSSSGELNITEGQTTSHIEIKFKVKSFFIVKIQIM